MSWSVEFEQFKKFLDSIPFTRSQRETMDWHIDRFAGLFLEANNQIK